MKFVQTYESFSSLTEEQKIKLQTIVNSIADSSIEKVLSNSEVANPRGKARNPFYDRGSRQLQGLGKPFGAIVPGSVNKTKDVITAEVSHGVKYESGLNREYKSIITMDAKTLDYEVTKIETEM